MTYEQVIVGSDGSETALIAVRRAASIAAGINAPLRVVCAYHPVAGRDQSLVPARVAEAKGRRIGQTAAERALDASVEVATAEGAKVQGDLVVGDAVDVLLKAAAGVDSALLVVGSRGMNRLSGRLLGAVPSDLSHRAESDVLIVDTIKASKAAAPA